MTSPQDQKTHQTSKETNKTPQTLIYSIILQYNPQVFMEEYHFTDGEVGTERSSDMPNVAKLVKKPRTDGLPATTASRCCTVGYAVLLSLTAIT